MDLAKFASMLAAESVYFACPTQFSDPYEGTLPRSHIDAEAKIIQSLLDPCLALRNQLAAQAVPAGAEDLCRRALQALDAAVDRMRYTTHKVTASKFGVSCWHESEHESDAMWKLYSASGQGIAIESTIGQLRTCFGNREGLLIDRVRYMDFDRDPIEKGYKHYKLFIKRKSFECEREVRATILLPEEGKGVPIRCDLSVLITCVHVSPLVEVFVKDAIEALCAGKIASLDKPVRLSPLYLAPDCKMDINTK